MNLQEVTQNLIEAVERYENVPLVETHELSEILRIVGVNLSWLVHLRKEAYKDFQYAKYTSKETTDAAKTREAEYKVPELDEIRKILRHYSELQSDLRTQISLHKKQDYS